MKTLATTSAPQTKEKLSSPKGHGFLGNQVLAPPDGLLVTRVKTYNGETATLILEGAITGANRNELLRLVDVLVANEYVNVVVDVTSARATADGIETLLQIQKKGARVVVG